MSSPEDPSEDIGDLSPPRGQRRAGAAGEFSPPGPGSANPSQWFLPAVQITLVSILAGAGCFVYAFFVSPARKVFAQPLPPIWAILVGLALSAMVALRVRRRPGVWFARVWPPLLLLLSLGLLAVAVYETRNNPWPLLNSRPWQGAWLHPLWQALVVALVAALVPLLFRLRHVRAHSLWLRRMGLTAVLVALALCYPVKLIEVWALQASSPLVNEEIERLTAVREAIEEAEKQSNPASADALSKIRASGPINERATWEAAEKVGATERLRRARAAVVIALVGLRGQIHCPAPPDAVPQPALPGPGPFNPYQPDDEITDYLQKEEDRADAFRRSREGAGEQHRQAARLCKELRLPKGLETEPLACNVAKQEAACPTAPATPTVGRAAIHLEDITPGVTLEPFLDPTFFQTLLGRNRKSLRASGCYPLPPGVFQYLLYCNIYGPRSTQVDTKDARVRLQTWAAFGEAGMVSPITDGSHPTQLLVTATTVGGPGKPIHGKLFEHMDSRAISATPGYDEDRCPRGLCFYIANGTQLIQIARRPGEEKFVGPGVLRLNGWVPPGSRQ